MNKKLLSLIGYGVGFVLLYLLVFAFPALNRINNFKKSVPHKQQEVEEMQKLQEEYLLAQKTYIPAFSPAQESESIFSLVERIAKARGLAENISSIKPITAPASVRVDSSPRTEDFQEVDVEVRMKNLSLQNLVSYLYTLGNPPYRLNVKDIQMNASKERLSLEATFIVSRWERK